MLKNKKGAALLQVLLVTVVLAGITTMLLRASLSRTTAARQTRRTVSGQMLVNACMAEINTILTSKSAASFARDLNQCILWCESPAYTTCPPAKQTNEYSCAPITISGITYTVTASMPGLQTADGLCTLNYSISAKNSSGKEIDVEF